jgi:P27 family predicted phage terminase small subunit
MSLTLHSIEGGDGEPPEPDWHLVFANEVDIEVARAEWGMIVREMKAVETLAVANGHAIQRLVEFRVQYRRAANQVAEHGAILQVKPEGKSGQWNPFWSVMRQADSKILILEAELGLAPRRRNSAGKAKKRLKVGRPADDYLNAAKRG